MFFSSTDFSVKIPSSINAAPASTTDGEIAYTYAYASFQYNAEYFQV